MAHVKLVLLVFVVMALVHDSSMATKEEDKKALVEARAASRLILRYVENATRPFVLNAIPKSNYDVREVWRMFRKYLLFRRANNFSRILEENWDDLRVRFPYTRNTFDKSGKPLLYINMGQWDLSSYLSSSDATSYDRLVRYVQMIHEESALHVYRLRYKEEHRGVYQYSHIINAGGFSVQKHACFKCMQLARDLANSMVLYVPTVLEKTVLVNVPHLFKVIYSVLGDEAQDNLQLYGQDQAQWRQMLLRYIDLDQLPLGILKKFEYKDNKEGLLMWNNEL